ncbi:hypothetical protein Tco_0761409, partial [Tanacetum coccineum]
HPSDTYVFIMKMEILLEQASNKFLVGYIEDGDGILNLVKVGSIPHALLKDYKTYYNIDIQEIMKDQD